MNAWVLKYENFDAGRSEGCAIEIEGSIELSFGREAGVDARRSEQIKIMSCLRD